MVSWLVLTIIATIWLVTGLPLLTAWPRLKHTSLRFALMWSWGAWFWGLVVIGLYVVEQPLAPLVYLFLVLCCGVLVAPLGAKEPGAGAWNFVVLGLLAVLAMPILEQPWHAVVWSVDGPRSLFLLLIIIVGSLNYLPTCYGWSTFLVAGTMSLILHQLQSDGYKLEHHGFLTIVFVGISAAIWMANGLSRTRSTNRAANPYDANLSQTWQDFRNRFGMVWGLRVMEQFNRSAANQKLSIQLGWFGPIDECQETTPKDLTSAHELLLQVVNRFHIQKRESDNNQRGSVTAELNSNSRKSNG